ncbi:DNA-binding FrmR family transcriptional regulator [Symbiobacterium terraclitae]|jgi:DNA-binding FrmR family transcriptional regulator|uniref:DNA-binding FrmR family transcriptional regulator n=1 Tax=Symbiobacterium terraclitae TaxID=557451 RepID=A0ABS4JT00_9FIRM|nr:metal-sensitive transcriptional regulator [Symbiobacterium terraclitae]MBP2018650.1 DNA-binding FrmR family transcriptional regulator [Symbiobacterium terraclitae]
MAEKRPETRVPLVRDKQAILDRLRKIEGQVRGLQRMVEEDRYCVDILNQVAAVEAALNKVGLMLLEGHAKGCMAAAVRRGEGDQAVAELMDVLGRFLK